MAEPVGARSRGPLGDDAAGLGRLVAIGSRRRPGQTILELAAGAGETGYLAASRLGRQGRLISSDFAPRMVEAAKRVAGELGIRNAEFRVLDAEHLDMEDASVDGVICRFGYMLMGDPGRALRETRRVIRDGGRLVFSVFGEPVRNPWMTVARGVMTERGYLPPPDRVSRAFSLQGSRRIEGLAKGAGFARSEVEEMEISFRFDNGDSLWTYVSELRARSRSRSPSSITRSDRSSDR